MLVSLAIRDLAVIEEATVELTAGLNCLTGETGAGKSIIIAALGLVLGDRAETELIRHGAEKAEVTGLFRVDLAGRVYGRMRDADLLDADDHALLLVRRLVAPQGKGRVWVNGRLVNVSTLANLTRGLIDISSQHQHTELLDAASHLELLDRFGGLDGDRAAYAVAYSAWQQAVRALRDKRKQAVERSQREEFTRFSLEEIDALNPKEGEDDALEVEYVRLGHTERLVTGADELGNALADGRPSALERLTVASRLAERLQSMDPDLASIAGRIESVRLEIDDIAHEVRDYGRSVDNDPRRLDQIASRLEALKKLKRKFGHSLDLVITARETLRAELNAFESLDVEIAEGETLELQRRDEAIAAGRALSLVRGQVRTRLEEGVSRELTSLAMKGARIRFDLQVKDVPGAEGFEAGEIVIETNAGEGFGPLGKVASGGELSRVLLALKRVLMHVDPVETCIFDEVDSGTGGAVGDMIGIKLHEIAQERQVLCITHLPQIAARGQAHLRVEKRITKDRTATSVARLSESERVEEIARMLGGLDITERTLAHAQELLARSAGN